MNNGVLKKNLGVTTAISIVVGCVIGSGIFFKPQAIYSATHGAPGSLDYYRYCECMRIFDFCGNRYYVS
ncbi:hypothetical protein [Eggerthia catenaformis]|uniref:hypothetical protein n=1 Tax=Eggerthia catenaformis TaxID=31973 RepID=UPI00248F0468|nr:hypothetical protein [Eggerthia catenaformis]